MLNIERLKSLRKQNNYKQIEVANILGIGRTTYAKYETGDIQPPIDQIIKISDFFNVTTDWLLNKSNDPKPPNKKEEKEPEAEEAKKVKWGEFGVSFGSGRDLNSLSDEEKDEITELLNFAIQQRIEKKKKKAEEDKEVGKSGDGKK